MSTHVLKYWRKQRGYQSSLAALVLLQRLYSVQEIAAAMERHDLRKLVKHMQAFSEGGKEAEDSVVVAGIGVLAIASSRLEKEEKAALVLVNLLASTGFSPTVRAASAWALGYLASPSTKTLLESVATGEDPLARAAQEALAKTEQS